MKKVESKVKKQNIRISETREKVIQRRLLRHKVQVYCRPWFPNN